MIKVNPLLNILFSVFWYSSKIKSIKFFIFLFLFLLNWKTFGGQKSLIYLVLPLSDGQWFFYISTLIKIILDLISISNLWSWWARESNNSVESSSEASTRWVKNCSCPMDESIFWSYRLHSFLIDWSWNSMTPVEYFMCHAYLSGWMPSSHLLRWTVFFFVPEELGINSGEFADVYLLSSVWFLQPGWHAAETGSGSSRNAPCIPNLVLQKITLFHLLWLHPKIAYSFIFNSISSILLSQDILSLSQEQFSQSFIDLLT